MSSTQRDEILREAFAYQPKLMAYAYSMLRNHSTAEDVVQNAYLVIIEKYDQFTPGTSLLSWCRTIVRFQVLSYIKKHKKVIVLEDQLLNDAVDAAFEACQGQVETVRHEHLRACLSKLPEKSRKTLNLRYKDKLGYDAISTSMGMKLEAVRKSLFRIKQKLKDCIELEQHQEGLA